MTKTEKYIKDAVKEAAKELSGLSISGCEMNMNFESTEAADMLAEALLEQAKANKEASRAMTKLAESLKPKDSCLIRMEGNSAIFGNDSE